MKKCEKTMKKAIGEKPLKKSSTIISKKNIDGTVSLMSLEDDERLYTVDGLAAKVWSEINGRRTIAEIIRCVRRKNKGLPSPRFEKDAEMFIKKLKKKNFLE